MKVFGVVLAAVLLASNNSGDRSVYFAGEPGDDEEVMIDESPAAGYDRESIDIPALLTAARGAPRTSSRLGRRRRSRTRTS